MEKLSILILFICYNLLHGQMFTCDGQPKDLAIILDSSGSISEPEFINAKTAIIKIMDALKENSRFAFQQFGSEAILKFNIDTKETFDGKKQIVKDANHTLGLTAIGKALELTVNEVHPKMSPSSIKLVILITDGTNNKWPVPQIFADKLKNSGVKIICVGIGSSVNELELRRLASDNAVILTSSFQMLLQDFKKILDHICYQPDPMPLKPCTVPQQDLLFIIDSSSSLSEEDYDNSRKFVKSFINHANIGSDTVRVGMISFAESVRLDFNIDAFTNKNDYIKAVDAAQKFGSLTAIGGALTVALNIVWPNHRNGVPFNIVLVTDGKNNKYPKPKYPATELKNKGAFIIPVAVGSDIDFNELKEISSNHKFITVLNYTELATSVTSVEKIVTCG